MFNNTTQILIDKYEVGSINEATVESGWAKFTDLATVKLARKMAFDGSPVVCKDYFKTGQAIVVKLGYNEKNYQRFAGFVSKVYDTVPFQMDCQDRMWKLKQTNITKTWKNIKLKALLQALVPGVQVKCVEATITVFSVEFLNAVQCLDKLRDEWGLYTFFRKGVLTCGLQYDPDTATTHTFWFKYDGAKHDGEGLVLANKLVFRNKADVKIRVKAINIHEDNSRTTVEVGDADGQEVTVHFYNEKDSELKKVAARRLADMHYDGYSGSFETFALPVVNHGDIVKLIDADYPERDGSYWVDEVKTWFTMSQGIKQEITIGGRLN